MYVKAANTFNSFQNWQPQSPESTLGKIDQNGQKFCYNGQKHLIQTLSLAR